MNIPIEDRLTLSSKIKKPIKTGVHLYEVEYLKDGFWVKEDRAYGIKLPLNSAYLCDVDNVRRNAVYRGFHEVNFSGATKETAKSNRSDLKILKIISQSKKDKHYGKCEACAATHLLTRHHVIPVSLKRKSELLNVILCRKCHNLLHKKKSNQELADEFNTIDKIIQVLNN